MAKQRKHIRRSKYGRPFRAGRRSPTITLLSDRTTDKDFRNLIGKRVLNVIEFDNGGFDSGFIIEFGNKIFLTAQDGEYGDNAFKFIDIEEVRKSKVVK
jgi:hypothetical protein